MDLNDDPDDSEHSEPSDHTDQQGRDEIVIEATDRTDGTDGTDHHTPIEDSAEEDEPQWITPNTLEQTSESVQDAQDTQEDLQHDAPSESFDKLDHEHSPDPSTCAFSGSASEVVVWSSPELDEQGLYTQVVDCSGLLVTGDEHLPNPSYVGGEKKNAIGDYYVILQAVFKDTGALKISKPHVITERAGSADDAIQSTREKVGNKDAAVLHPAGLDFSKAERVWYHATRIPDGYLSSFQTGDFRSHERPVDIPPDATLDTTVNSILPNAQHEVKEALEDRATSPISSPRISFAFGEALPEEVVHECSRAQVVQPLNETSNVTGGRAASALQVMRVRENAKLPVRASEGAAGYDLSCHTGFNILPFERKKVPIGISLRLPEMHYGRIADRSSMALKGIDVRAGVIDTDYRGELVVVLHNTGNEMWSFQAGERIAQLIIERISTPSIHETTELAHTKRDAGGFGSTGTGSIEAPVDAHVVAESTTRMQAHIDVQVDATACDDQEERDVHPREQPPPVEFEVKEETFRSLSPTPRRLRTTSGTIRATNVPCLDDQAHE